MKAILRGLLHHHHHRLDHNNHVTLVPGQSESKSHSGHLPVLRSQLCESKYFYERKKLIMVILYTLLEDVLHQKWGQWANETGGSGCRGGTVWVPLTSLTLVLHTDSAWWTPLMIRMMIINHHHIIIIITIIKTNLPTSAIPIFPTPDTKSQIFALSTLVIPGAVANLIDIDLSEGFRNPSLVKVH